MKTDKERVVGKCLQVGNVAYAWAADSMESGYFIESERASDSDVLIFARPIESESEAKIYDASQDLLAALKSVIYLCEHDLGMDEENPYIEKACAAIAKAEGRE